VEHGAQDVSDEQALLESERAAEPFLCWRDGAGRQIVLALRGARWRVTIGRSTACDVALTWDARVSRSHALLERVAGGWTVIDDGLSRNGTFLNGRRVVARRRLADSDRLTIGDSRLTYREPVAADPESTAVGEEGPSLSLSPMQREVLTALCRPLGETPAAAAVPATNRQIADEVHLSVDAVKAHLRAIADRLGLGQLPQNEKRARLARAALAAGLVTRRDF
jgi:DNA-binding NarL/FixJ family response regulator